MLSAPTIISIQLKKMIGLRMFMSFANDKTLSLWSTFMPRRKEIVNTVSQNLYNIQLYNKGFFSSFDPAAEFEKIAAVEVDDFTVIPAGMEAFTIPGGQYAVFNYTGTGEDADEVYKYIQLEWLPKSGFKLAVRPHFETMGDKYRHGHRDSEEEIWLPITL